MNYNQDFVKEEVICDWKVSETIKKVWWIQLDLLKQFDKICKDNNLKWYPMWGTLLGVIRHKGFIPWDDDVDIVMPRSDYERFKEVCDDLLKEPYYLQTTIKDKECYYMWISLRNSQTTGNRITCLSKKQNNGIGIDIMPLDGCEDSPSKYKISRFPVRVISVLANTYVNDFNQSMIARVLRRCLRLFNFDYKKAYLWAENQNMKFKWEDYPRVAFRAHADPLTKVIQRDMWLKEDFETTIDMPFEDMMIPVPVGYDRLLKQIYGDYMKFPPLDKRQGKHDVIYMPDTPYKEYCSKKFGVKY